tara:strand:+ start:41636 stop:45664 length:4029 start_codon:yes stop_codon:yes gene_type:complete
MPENKNLFFEGKMNKDLDSRLVPNGQYRDALNFRVASSSGSDVGALENSLSNKKLTNLSLGANPITIGMLCDNTDNKIYWLVSSDSGDYVIEHHPDTGLTSIVLEDTSAGVLNFNQYNLVTGINLIPDSDNDIRLLCWTDNLNPPRCINVDRAKAYGANNFTEADISLAKAPPISPPTINLSTSTVVGENNIEERFLRFATQYQFLDGEYSAFSAFSETAFLPTDFNYNFALASNESMINRFNNVDIAFNTGPDIVKSINLVFKESGSSVVSLIGNFNKADEGWADNTEESQEFSNNKVYQALSADQLLRIYDATPLKALAQEVIGNRLIFGNYTENYDIATVNGTKIPITFTLEKVNTAIANGVATKSLKSNRDYEIGMVYSDDFGRMTTVLPSTKNTTYFRSNECTTKNQIKAIISHEAPAFASKYRFFIKQSRVDYDTLIPTLIYQDGIYIWIRLEGDEVDKISEGEFIYVKSDTQQVLGDAVQTKVLEIKTQPWNFLELSTVTTTEQLAGVYFRVKAEGYSLNVGDFTLYQYDSYDNLFSIDSLNPIRNLSAVIEPAVYYGTAGLDDLTQSGTFTNGTDIRYIVEIDGVSGPPDTFKWSDDDGASYTINVPIVAGPILLNHGVSVTFGATTGHTITTDRWIISAKSPTDNGLGTEETTHTYSIFKSLPSNGNINQEDRIKGGAQINIVYRQTGAPTNEDIDVTFTASKEYANLEEWFFGDSIETQLGGVLPTDMWLRRGTSLTSGSGTAYFTQDSTADMCLLIKSADAVTPFSSANSELEIFQSAQRIIFETIPLNDDSQFFYEIGRTYDIDVNRNHLGFDAGDVDQNSLINAEIILPVFNCYSWGNGFESYKIKDLFNARTMKIDSRPLDTIQDYRQNIRIADLTYSKPYEQTTNYNGLNEFNLSTSNFKSMDDKYQSIQKLFSRDTDLRVYQQDKVHKVLFSKDVLFDADGSGNIRESSKVLGQEVAYAGEYGISTHPESHASYGNYEYWTDVRRGVVLRSGLDGITEISSNGMGDYFKDSFIETRDGKKLGAYDLFNNQYVLFVNNVAPTILQTLLGGTTFEVLAQPEAISFVSEVRASSGNVLINYNVTGTINIKVTEEGVQSDLGNVTGTGTLSYNRTDDTVKLLTVLITPITVGPSFTIDIPEPIDVLAPVVALDDTLNVFRAKSDDINVLFNDTFVDPVTVTITVAPVKGVAVVNSNKTINYVHGNADLLPDVLTYQIDDGTTTATADMNVVILADTSGGVNGIAFNISTDSFFSPTGNGEGACTFTIDDIKYHDGVGVYPLATDIIYNEIGKTTLFAGGGKYYNMDGGKTIKINDSGVVSDLWICGISTI